MVRLIHFAILRVGLRVVVLEFRSLAFGSLWFRVKSLCFAVYGLQYWSGFLVPCIS